VGWQLSWDFIIKKNDDNYITFNSKLTIAGLDKIDSAIIIDAGRKLQTPPSKAINQAASTRMRRFYAMEPFKGASS